jgi:hypothetical protein
MSTPECPRGRTDFDLAEASRLLDALADLIGSGAPLDSLSRAHAMGLVIRLECRLPASETFSLLRDLREWVRGDRPMAASADHHEQPLPLVRRLQYRLLGLRETIAEVAL